MSEEKIDKLAGEVAELKVMTSDLIEAIHAFSGNVDQRFEASSKELRATEASLRDFIDRRVANGVAEIAPVIRKVDEKDTALVDRLQAKKVLAPADVEEIIAMSPFPQSIT